MRPSINPHTGCKYKKQSKKGLYELIGHFKIRMTQRYNIIITNEEIHYFANCIENRNYAVAKFIERQSNSRSIHEIYLKRENIWIPVAYNDKIKMLITALPKNYKETTNPYTEKLKDI